MATTIRVQGGPSAAGCTPEMALPEVAGAWRGAAGAGEWVLTFDLGLVNRLAAVTVDRGGSALQADSTVDVSSDGVHWQAIGALPPTALARVPLGMPVRFVRLSWRSALPEAAPEVHGIEVGAAGAAPAGLGDVVRCPSRVDGTLQPARFLAPTAAGAVPLVVGLHTWSGDYRQLYMPAIEAWCAEQGWAYIHPDFRGPSWTPEATGSDLAVADILDAVAWARTAAAIDGRRIYLVGGSGGGFHALLMAGRAPEVWAGVSAWVPISDLAAWYHECRARQFGYAEHIVRSCGGAPGSSPAVDEQLRRRSPLTWLAQARGLPLDINAGIHDGHRGSVPVSHSLRAFNAVAAAGEAVAEDDIRFMVEHEAVPAALQDTGLIDDSYGARRVLFRRHSGAARVTLFEGGHEVVESAARAWLSRQCRG